ncbi:two-component sensor histidine kinase, partial [Mesorhizobium sp. M00.F.Ca.ET.186.01.1.1]
MSEKKRITLFRYWTTRYLITLCIGLLVIGIASSFWINYSEKQKRLDFMRLMAAEVSDRVVDADGKVVISPFLFRLLESRQESLRVNYKPFMVILDANHRAVFGGRDPLNSELRRMAQDLVEADESMSQVKLERGEELLFVKKSIRVNQ